MDKKIIIVLKVCLYEVEEFNNSKRELVKM